jgi:type II secretory pathway pseudopilin PulG
VALVGVALIIAVTYVITRPQSPTNTDAAVAAATQQVQTQDASQQAQSAATQAQSAADSAAQASQRAAMSGAAPAPAPSAPPPSQPAQPSQGDDSGGGPPQ